MFTALLLLPLGAAGAVRAAQGFSHGGFMGLNLTPATTAFTATARKGERDTQFAGSLGFRLSPQWRIGGELSYSAKGNDGGGETESRLALVNLYYDIDVGSSRFQPFLSIGAGLASADFYRGGIDGLGIATSTDTAGIWQAGAGMNYQISDDVALSGGYRHLGFSDSAGGIVSKDDGSHELRVGVTWKMPVKRNRGGPETRD